MTPSQKMTILGGHFLSPHMPLSCGFTLLTLLHVTLRDVW
jgi:hypothetical protein